MRGTGIKLTTEDNNVIETTVGKSTMVETKAIKDIKLQLASILPMGAKINVVTIDADENVSFQAKISFFWVLIAILFSLMQGMGYKINNWRY